jgi:hypothetical protein
MFRVQPGHVSVRLEHLKGEAIKRRTCKPRFGGRCSASHRVDAAIRYGSKECQTSKSAGENRTKRIGKRADALKTIVKNEVV